MASLKLTVPEGTPLVNGKQITFRTPYGSSRLNGIEIDNYIFEVLDSNNRPPSSRLFSPGSMITVVLDMDHMIAYIPSDGIRLGKDADATDTAALAATLDEIGVNSENLSVSDKVKDMFGLSNGYIDDALESIGKYAQHWWARMATTSHWEIQLQDSAFIEFWYLTNEGEEIVYGTEVSMDGDGAITLLNQNTLTLSGTNTVELGDAIRSLVGKYAYFPTYVADLEGVYDRLYYVEAVNDFMCESGTGGYTINFNGPRLVESVWVDGSSGVWTNVQSNDRNAYPDAGIEGNYEYQYLGIPFDNAVAASKVVTGSYVGTDTFGESNPNSLTFDFAPKLVMLTASRATTTSPSYPNGYAYTNLAIDHFNFVDMNALTDDGWAYNYGLGGLYTGDSYCKKSADGKTILWYSTTAHYQANAADTTYFYIAIG